MIFLAFQMWPSEKFECFRVHMDIVLNKPELTEQEVEDHAGKFTYLPPNAVIKRSYSQPLINKATYEQ